MSIGDLIYKVNEDIKKFFIDAFFLTLGIFEIDPDNRLNGFAAFENGFSLENRVTTCTFDALFPVSGTVNINGGNLYLNQDVILHR